MCGIAGIFDRTANSPEVTLRDGATRMARILAHRGPDSEGVWTDSASGVALAHRRLAIIDCTPAGHQPMASACGRYMISYNGEIYNYKEIASELADQGHIVKGGSDTAVLLAACVAWGVEKAIKRCVGMFAFALWNHEKRELTLARDRLGIKPVYWTRIGELFLFSSQLKAFKTHPSWRGEIDRNALVSYLRHAYVPAPHTIYQNVWKLLPGHILHIPANGETRLTCYWNNRELARDGHESPYRGSYDDARDTLEGLLHQAIGDRMISDVPLGAFLSGGVDSSAVAALMQAQSSRPIRTFSIGFQEQSYDESAHAATVAAHLGTNHTALFVTPTEARDLIPQLPNWYDEPFADSSQIPTLALSQLTRHHVTVALSGDGGDEVFAGYNRYIWAERLWKIMSCLPHGCRNTLSSLSHMLPIHMMNRIGNAVPGQSMPRQIGDKVQKIGGIFAATDIDSVYRKFISQWPNPDLITVEGAEPHSILWDDSVKRDRPDTLGRMQLLDMSTYLPDDILTKVDRASMAFGLEARVPLIDHRVVEFAWSLPRNFLVRRGRSKSILRDILYKHVPQHLIERPKMGFGIPLDSWLRGPLRDWAESLLDENRLRQDGFFDPVPVRSALKQHLSCEGNMSYGLWAILMFQAWHEHNPVAAE